MIRAASTDGVLGFELLSGLLRQAARPLAEMKTNFEFLVDEGCQTPDKVKDSHLIVVGTGEVNILAMFLQQLLSANIKISGVAAWLQYNDNQGAVVPWPAIPREKHPGALFLLKNPWDLTKYLLWVGGLDGVATAGGARLIMSPPEDYPENATKAHGVIYQTDCLKSKIEFKAWLDWQNGVPVWKTAPNAATPLGATPLHSKRRGRAHKGPSVNERMLSMIQKDNSRVSLTAEQWADELVSELGRPVTAAAVKQTETWKHFIIPERARLKGEKPTYTKAELR